MGGQARGSWWLRIIRKVRLSKRKSATSRVREQQFNAAVRNTPLAHVCIPRTGQSSHRWSTWCSWSLEGMGANLWKGSGLLQTVS